MSEDPEWFREVDRIAGEIESAYEDEQLSVRLTNDVQDVFSASHARSTERDRHVAAGGLREGLKLEEKALLKKVERLRGWLRCLDAASR